MWILQTRIPPQEPGRERGSSFTARRHTDGFPAVTQLGLAAPLSNS